MTTPVIVLGASGYVGGEFLRLIAAHPQLALAAAVSQSLVGEPITDAFPHLRLAYPGECFVDANTSIPGTGAVALLGAAPHGASAQLLEKFVSRFDALGRDLIVVDTSADFRLDDLDLYGEIYGEHGAPALKEHFFCGLPELSPEVSPKSVAHPGCFTTCTTLAAAPLHRSGWTRGRLTVTAVTGSTGSGKSPKRGTHHPERHGGLVAYGRTDHRHRHEMTMLLTRYAQCPVELSFVPHSGPFARGIHVTLHAELDPHAASQSVLACYEHAYAECPFVHVTASAPHLKEVVGSNLCRIGVAQASREVVVTAVVDNLVKGAAGGAIQWLNRALELPESTGLLTPAIGWN